MERYALLHRVMEATEPLSRTSSGGAHTDVFALDGERLRRGLAALRPEGKLDAATEELVEGMGRDFLVKKGKIQHFSMPLLGKQNNNIRRTLMSYAFGPVGYSVMPTLEKTLLDASEAARLIPYLGYGALDGLFAPDFLQGLAQPGSSRENRDAVFLRRVLNGDDHRTSAYELWQRDPYFHGNISSAEDLATYQAFLRRNPLCTSMDEVLSEFFEDPITVGVRDTLRRLGGSRHPGMPWDQAKSLILGCYARHGRQNFLLPEITYYSYDTALTPAQLTQRMEHNRAVATLLSAELEEALPEAARPSWHACGPVVLTAELLDFHHDYPVYSVEPYTGFLSTSSAKMTARLALALFLQAVDGPEPRVRNLDFSRLPPFHRRTQTWFSTLDTDTRERVLDALPGVLSRYDRRRGVRDGSGHALLFTPMPRTFYTFQKRATVPAPGNTPVSLHTIHDLWLPENAGFWQRFPELSDKLTVFFTQAYRYFQDTGFVPDLRPRDAGRDIFIYGIWGHITDNLLVAEEKDGAGNPVVQVRYVDNRDQFKQYRRTEDRRRPLGMAKYALRFIHPVVEPGMVRSIGIFVDQVRLAQKGATEVRATLPDPVSLAELAVDVTYKLVKDNVDAVFTSSKAVVDDLVDDVHAGSRNLVKRVGKSTSKRGRQALHP